MTLSYEPFTNELKKFQVGLTAEILAKLFVEKYTVLWFMGEIPRLPLIGTNKAKVHKIETGIKGKLSI
ncbi:hypothetical protein GCM10027442_12090 [Emticicia fontis]